MVFLKQAVLKVNSEIPKARGGKSAAGFKVGRFIAFCFIYNILP